MAKVAVVHPVLSYHQGGAEAVCMHVLEALQDRHEVSLVTWNEPDLSQLNRYFNTEVSAGRIRTHQVGLPAALVHVLLSRAATMKQALLHRFVRRVTLEYDLVVSTQGLFYLAQPSVQYVHYPEPPILEHGRDRTAFEPYYRLCEAVFSFDTPPAADGAILANSRWTAARIEEVQGAEADVVYPPVDVGQFAGQPWEERERGFVTIGRVGPLKRVIQSIEVIVALRERGHDVHLHVVGPPTNGAYYQRIVRKAAGYEYVHVEGELEFEELVETVCSHRYGIHGMREEHFGIAVAQMIAGGAIPFVPGGGGQVEIVDGRKELLYRSAAEAVEKIEHVLTDRTRQEELHHELRARATKFGRERFRREIRRRVREKLADDGGGPG